MAARFSFLRPLVRRYCAQQKGAAAAEFALVLSLLTLPILNVVDFAFYVWDRMLTDNASHIAVQAAWATCDTAAKLPATSNCTGLNTAVTAGAQSTTLGNRVSVTSTQEGYYCVTTGATPSLVLVATPPTAPPANCGGNGGSASDKPGDYIRVTVSFTYAPIFPGLSIVSQLASPINRTGWMRLG